MKTKPTPFSPWETFVACFGLFLVVNIVLGLHRVFQDPHLSVPTGIWILYRAGLLLCLVASLYLLRQLWQQLRLFLKIKSSGTLSSPSK